MTKIIDPWGAELPEDYAKIMKDFGLEEFDKDMFPNPNRIMRRGITFAGRDLKVIAKAIHDKKPFYTLTGLMPSSDQIHLGNKLVVENLRYFQDHGAETFILVADLECAATRGVSIEEGRNVHLNFIFLRI
jgi:tryptophanyl-tRNA synthetase